MMDPTDRWEVHVFFNEDTKDSLKDSVKTLNWNIKIHIFKKSF